MFDYKLLPFHMQDSIQKVFIMKKKIKIYLLALQYWFNGATWQTALAVATKIIDW